MLGQVISVKHLAVACVFVAACGGGVGGGVPGDERGGGNGDDCHSTADCDDGLECAGVNDARVCGIPPQEQCGSNADCGGGTVCHATSDVCSPDGVGSTCGEPCVGDAECGAAFQCDGGSCIARACDAGFACADREECDPSRIASTAAVFDRHHGCFAVECSADADCIDGFCVNNTCQDAVGVCTEPVAVP